MEELYKYVKASYNIPLYCNHCERIEGEEIVYVEDGIYIPIMQQTPPPPLPPKQTTPPVIKEVSDDMLLEKPTIDLTSDNEPRVYSEPIPEIAYTEIPEATDNIFHGFELGKQPAYPGGTPKFLADIANNFMLSERDYNEKGRIFVQFVIEKRWNYFEYKSSKRNEYSIG